MRSSRVRHRLAIVVALLCAGSAIAEDHEFFTQKVEPLLRERCFECHSHEKKIKGGLALDSKAGWEQGGESGSAIVPGAPEKSRLITAVRHSDPDLKMPPKHKLADEEIALLVEWVRRGAPDPRPAIAARDWDSLYRERLAWWSLQPVVKPSPPAVKDASWPRNEVDRFILAALEEHDLKPVAEADRHTLARRLSFALTGLPPSAEDLTRDFDSLVQSLLDSPHFGEHWARHWMDVVHYSDTHGYEWDTPARNAWMFRDYLIRAFNTDVSFQQLVLEQIAGDLIPPRLDARTGMNESIVGPMALRLGERRHGDSGMFEGIAQETTTNIIDTVSKGFLATTVACAQCHDHKLDAVAQRDYYALAGLFMSTRWSVRSVETADPNVATIDELRRIKADIRGEIARLWLASRETLVTRIQALPAKEAPKGLPDSIAAIWQAAPLDAAWTKLAGDFQREHEKRIADNRMNLHPVADFTRGEIPAGWQIDGLGMTHGLVRDGEPVITGEGDAALAHLLPAGRWSHAWSPRLAGAVRSPLFDPQAPVTLSVGYAGGQFAAQSFIVDQSFHCERMKFLSQAPAPGWLTFNTAAPPQRRAYLELVTKSLNNYFPPRTNYGGLKAADVDDARSWLGVTRVVEHAAGKAPQDELSRFTTLWEKTPPYTSAELAVALADLVMQAVERWNAGRCDSEDVRLINDALVAKLLPNEAKATTTLAGFIARYRAVEQKIQPERTIGSVAEWNEARDERIGVRGSYTELGDVVPRGNIRFLGGAAERACPPSSGRLEFAHSIASERNPLTARVFVNRVWLHLFGEGLVRTPDDFGHLGAQPSHPEFLDYLATRFVEEGWSVKKLVRLLVTSATWRQGSIPDRAALVADADNRLWHHLPMRRLEAEAIRDAMLAVTGRLDPALYGPPVDPYRSAQDPAKRLFSGPIDGNGRRSLYTKMTMMEPPRFLALFNQPIPKLTTGRRDVTNVPDQALALLNDPFVIAMAKHWSERVLQDGTTEPEQRAAQMFTSAFARTPGTEETARLVKLAQCSAELHGVSPGALMNCQPVWQDVAHAIFNLKEFIHVP